MKKENKLYNYCFTCGYLGVKDNPKNCDHFKFKQLQNYSIKSISLDRAEELQFKGLQDFIYKKSWMNSKVYTIPSVENSPIVVVCELTKTQAKKPLHATIKMIKDLVCAGFVLEFTDPNGFAPNKNLIPVLYEIADRSAALFKYDESQRFTVMESIKSDEDYLYHYIPKEVTILEDDSERIKQLAVNKAVTAVYTFVYNEETRNLHLEKIIKLI